MVLKLGKRFLEAFETWDSRDPDPWMGMDMAWPKWPASWDEHVHLARR